MRNTLTELWNGNINPINSLDKNNIEIEHLKDLIQRNLKNLEESLDENSTKALKKFTDCINEYIGIINEEAFCDGFCLGTRIIIEALTEQ